MELTIQANKIGQYLQRLGLVKSQRQYSLDYLSSSRSHLSSKLSKQENLGIKCYVSLYKKLSNIIESRYYNDMRLNDTIINQLEVLKEQSAALLEEHTNRKLDNIGKLYFIP